MLEKSLGVNIALAYLLVLSGPDSKVMLVFPQIAFFLWIQSFLHKEPLCSLLVTQLPFTPAPLAFLFPEQLFAKRVTQSSGSSAQSGGAPLGPSQLTLSKIFSGTRASQLL